MIKGNKVFVLIVLLCNCICFPKIVWVYWNTGFEHAPLLYQLTLKNTQAQLKDGGWDIRIIDDKTIDKWLKVEEVDQFMKESQFRTFIQLRSDYIRMRLLIEHGGVWLDTGIVLLEDLSWLDHLHENPQAQGTSQDPTVLMFYFTIHGSM